MSAVPVTGDIMPGVAIEIWDNATKEWVTRPVTYLAVNVKFRYAGQPSHTYLVTGAATLATVIPVEILS
jgi:hypothetical protein